VTVATDSVRNALEQSPEKVVSHLHPEGSFDIADHVVPTGREEVWRFTPLKRLRGIHQDAPLDGHSFTVEVHAADGVTAEAVGGIDAGLRADQHETGADLLRFVASHDAVVIEVEASEELVRARKRFLPSQFGFGRRAGERLGSRAAR